MSDPNNLELEADLEADDRAAEWLREEREAQWLRAEREARLSPRHTSYSLVPVRPYTRYAARCESCGNVCAPGQGVAALGSHLRYHDFRWVVYHMGKKCMPAIVRRSVDAALSRRVHP